MRTWEEMDEWENKHCVIMQPYKRGFVEGEHGKNSYSVPVPLCSNPLQLCVSFLSFLISILVQFYAHYRVRRVDLDLCGHLWISMSNAFQIVETQILFRLNMF